MIDLDRDEILSTEAARLWLGQRLGHTPAKPTMQRWITAGARGTVLETILVGSRRYTSKEAVGRFIGERSGSRSTPTARRKKEIEAASQACDVLFDAREIT